MFNEALDLKRAVDSAQGKYRNLFKRAETIGINRAMLALAIKESQRERDKREIDYRDFEKYMQWLGMPIGTQASMFDNDEDTGGRDAGGGGEGEGGDGDGAGDGDEESEEDRAATERMRASIAYHQGHAAGLAGANSDSCPFAAGTEDAQFWVSGLHAGFAEAKEREKPTTTRRRGRPRTPPADQAPPADGTVH